MKFSASFSIIAGLALLTLVAAVAAGYLQTHKLPYVDQRMAGASLSQKQMMERRRASVGVVAIAGTTSQ